MSVTTGSNFNNFFLGKVEENVEGANLAIHRLEKDSVNGPIRKELGTEREETTLTYLFDLIKKQTKGEKRLLLTDGYANIAYIRGNDGSLWVVGACWDLRLPLLGRLRLFGRESVRLGCWPPSHL